MNDTTGIDVVWSDPEMDPTYDWTGSYRGKDVDLVRYDGDNTWAFFYEVKPIEEGLPSKEAAKEALYAYLQSIND